MYLGKIVMIMQMNITNEGFPFNLKWIPEQIAALQIYHWNTPGVSTSHLVYKRSGLWLT